MDTLEQIKVKGRDLKPRNPQLTIEPSLIDNKNSSKLLEKKIPHKDIEKNRRIKMNKRLDDLSLCLQLGKSKKIDKLSVLKIAVQHMKNIKASNSVLNDGFLCQSFINKEELKSLLLNNNDEFLIVIKCDSGKILYASETCSNTIGYKPSELIDRLFFEIIHPNDIKQVKDQLFTYDANNSFNIKNETVINKEYNSGNRRSFFCRIQNNFTGMDRKLSIDSYKVVKFLSYLSTFFESNLSKKSSNSTVQHYLIAYGSVESEQNYVNKEFMTKYDLDGKFTYTESCLYSILGYLPNQLKSESIFNLVQNEDLAKLKKSFQMSIKNPNTEIITEIYRIQTGHSSKTNISVRSILFALKNPYSGCIECIRSSNQIIPSSHSHQHFTSTNSALNSTLNSSPQSNTPGYINNSEIKPIPWKNYPENLQMNSSSFRSTNKSSNNYDTRMNLNDNPMSQYLFQQRHYNSKSTESVQNTLLNNQNANQINNQNLLILSNNNLNEIDIRNYEYLKLYS